MKNNTNRNPHKLESAVWPEIFIKDPSIEVIGKGRLAFIWIGNDSPQNKACYATLSGPKKLEKLAREILLAVKPKRKQSKITKRTTEPR